MKQFTKSALDKATELKAATTAAEAVRRKILDGLLAPGQRLIEAELIQELGVGRSTIREALLKLDADGLVELRHQRGAVVKRMSRRDMGELFAIRERLEGLAAAEAAERINEGDNRQRLLAARAVWEQEDILLNEIAHMEKNVPYHDLIITLSGNVRLARMLQPLQIPGYRMQFLKLLDRPYRETSAQDHIEIADAILAGNTDLADTLMRKHVHHTGEVAQRIPGLV